VPTPEPDPPTRISSISWVTFGTNGTRRDPGSLGGAVYSASTSVSSTSASARTMFAMSAERRSLSPKRISLLASASFSLTIGTTPSSSIVAIVRRALRYWRGCIVSSAVISSCPTRMPYRPNAASYCAMSSPCPTEAAACWVATSVGRELNPSGPKPAAIAPDETSTMLPPSMCTWAIAPTSAVSLSTSRCPDG
jgi:hypothetical protein